MYNVSWGIFGMFQSSMFWCMSSNRTSSSKRLCFGATSWVWFSCSLSKLLFLGDIIEEEDEDKLDLNEMREKECNRRDMINLSSNIITVIWFHRNISVSIYVTKFLGSERKSIFFYSQYSLSNTSIATNILCLNILSEQYTLVLLPFIIHGSYCYSIIQLKYQTVVLPENTIQTYTV